VKKSAANGGNDAVAIPRLPWQYALCLYPAGSDSSFKPSFNSTCVPPRKEARASISQHVLHPQTITWPPLFFIVNERFFHFDFSVSFRQIYYRLLEPKMLSLHFIGSMTCFLNLHSHIQVFLRKAEMLSPVSHIREYFLFPELFHSVLHSARRSSSSDHWRVCWIMEQCPRPCCSEHLVDLMLDMSIVLRCFEMF
jgi:hypothetical protein